MQTNLTEANIMPSVANVEDEREWEVLCFKGENPEEVRPLPFCTASSNVDAVSQLISRVSFLPDALTKKKRKSAKKSKKSKKKLEHMYESLLSCSNWFDNPVSAIELGQVPDDMSLILYRDGGVFLGRSLYCGRNQYVGKPQDKDGHIMVVGGTGSGKSACVAHTTLESYDGVIVALDVKGELVAHWKHKQKTKRPFKIFNPNDLTSSSYDPLYHIRHDIQENLFSNVYELVQAVIPLSHNNGDCFWIKAARKILIASIIFYLDLNLSFIEILQAVADRPISKLIQEIGHGDNMIAKRLISSYLIIDDLSESKMLMDVSEELNIHIMEFIADIRVQKALTPTANTIRWDEDIQTQSIFISIPENKLNQWGGMITLMLTQLIKALERRPEKYTPEGQRLPPVLLMLDEFPRIGKMDVITDAMATLRSKNITFCLFIQSLAQLDHIYGGEITRIILDLCDYKAILRINDNHSQKIFSELIGTAKVWSRSYNQTFDPYSGKVSYSRNLNEIREPIMYPHDLSALNENMILITPSGYCQLKKIHYHYGL